MEWKRLTLNLTDVIIKITLVRFETGKVFIKMGRVVVVTFDENEEEKLNELLHFDLQTIYWLNNAK